MQVESDERPPGEFQSKRQEGSIGAFPPAHTHGEADDVEPKCDGAVEEQGSPLPPTHLVRYEGLVVDLVELPRDDRQCETLSESQGW